MLGRKNRGSYTNSRVVPHVCKAGNDHLQQRQSGRERNVAWQPVPYITLSEKVERFGNCRRVVSLFQRQAEAPNQVARLFLSCGRELLVRRGCGLNVDETELIVVDFNRDQARRIDRKVAVAVGT